MVTTERKPSAVGIDPQERVNLLSNGLSGTNLERGSSHNLRVTLQAIRLNAPVTKVELAEITGLTPPSITNIARKLFADGLIVEAGRRRGERGQPALKLAINPDGAFSIGIKLGRRSLDVLLLDFAGQARERWTIGYDFPDPDAVLPEIGLRLRDIRRKLGPERRERLQGIGIETEAVEKAADCLCVAVDFGLRRLQIARLCRIGDRPSCKVSGDIAFGKAAHCDSAVRLLHAHQTVTHEVTANHQTRRQQASSCQPCAPLICGEPAEPAAFAVIRNVIIHR